MTHQVPWAWLLPSFAFLAGALAAALAVAWAQRRRHAAMARRLADDLRLMASANPAHRAKPQDQPGWHELAGAVNDIGERLLHRQRDEQARLQAERDAAQAQQLGLTGLLTQMPQAVLLCDGQGHVLLYNDAARRLFGAGDGQDGTLALGRALPGLIDRHLWSHVRDAVRLRHAAGEADPGVHFVFGTRGGALARARMAGLPEATAGDGERYVLTMDNVTEQFAASQHSDTLIDALTRSSRAALAAIRASVETLLDIPDLAPDRQRELVSIIDDEARRLGQRIEQAEREYTQSGAPPLSVDELPAADLLGAAARRMGDKLAAEVHIQGSTDGLWLRLDSYAIVQLLSALASRLKYELRVAAFGLSATRHGRHVHIDLSWDSPAMDADLWRLWQGQPLRLGGEASTLSVTDVMARSGGEIWYLLEGARPVLRLVLQAADVTLAPVAAAPVAAPAWAASDATLQDASSLAGCSCTVWSSALQGPPAAARGDVIAAARVMRARVVAAESWHGDPAQALEIQLPALARFGHATLLVSADDGAALAALRGLQVRSGAAFDQPALDLLALGRAVLSGHDIDSAAALAVRLGLPLQGEPGSVAHAQALGALWCALLPLLRAAGITTFEQAHSATQAMPGKGRTP